MFRTHVFLIADLIKRSSKFQVSGCSIARQGQIRSHAMALSKWEYVKTFESDELLLPNCWAVARLDGRGFHKLARKHSWTRPNDIRGINLMSRAARSVMSDYEDIVLAYGQSDEYSFVFRREAEVFQRRGAKIMTTVVSRFSSAFVFYWNDYFPDTKLLYPPSFDGRMVLYPTDQNLRDYLCWRQADCHINNLYNTTFWSLVQLGGLSNMEAEKRLMGTLAGDKNEILFSQFGINYNNEPQVYRKGTLLIQNKRTSKRTKPVTESTTTSTDTGHHRSKDFRNITEANCDIIGDKFWTDNPHILLGNPIPKPTHTHSNSIARRNEIELTV